MTKLERMENALARIILDIGDIKDSTKRKKD